MTTALYAVYIIISILLIVVILMQKGKNQGLSLNFGATSVGDTYFSKNKSKTFEGKLETFTKVGIFVFIVLAIALNYIINTQTTTPKSGISSVEGQVPAEISDKPYIMDETDTVTPTDNGTTMTPDTVEPGTTPAPTTEVAPVAPTVAN